MLLKTSSAANQENKQQMKQDWKDALITSSFASHAVCKCGIR